MEAEAARIRPPILSDDEVRRILKACEGQGFADRRDTAVVRTFLARDFADAVLRLIGTVRPLLTDASRVSWEQTERVHRDLAA